MERKNYKFESERGVIYYYSDISQEETLSLIQQTEGQLIPEFSIMNKVYLLNDKSIINSHGYIASLYPTINDFFIMMYVNYQPYFHPPAGKKILQGFPRPRLFRYSEDIVAEHLQISGHQARRLAKLDGPPDHTYNSLYARYDTSDKKALLICMQSDPCYLLFNKQTDCDLFIDRFNKDFASASNEPQCRFLLGRNPYGKEFPEHVPKLIGQLEELLELTPEDLHLTVKNLYALQARLKTYVFTDHFFDILYLPLLAWIGAFQVQNIGGQWYMKYDKKYQYWFPMIEVEGEIHNIGVPIFNIINPDSEYFPPIGEALFSKTKAAQIQRNELFKQYRLENPPADPATITEY
jgi:hypothetical protein